MSLFKKSLVNRANEMTCHYEVDKFLSDPRAQSSEDILELWKGTKKFIDLKSNKDN